MIDRRPPRWWWILVALATLLPRAGDAQVITLTPSLTVGGEYNDNVFLAPDKEDDFLATFTPAITLAVERPTYRLSGEYSFTSEVYDRFTELNDAFARQHATLLGSYRPTARLTLGLNETYARDRQTNVVSPLGLATGFVRSWSNSFAPSLAYEIDPRTTLRLLGSWLVQRYDQAALPGTDEYRIEAGVERALTARLSGTLGYQFAIIDIEGEDTTYTHTPRVGLVYRLTETLTASASAGPVFVTDGETRTEAAATAVVRQRLPFGAASLAYDRGVGTAPGFGGVTTNQTISGTLEVTTWVKDLTISFTPRYTTSESSDTGFDVRAAGVNLQATYRFTRWLGVVAAYSFFKQWNDSGVGTSQDIDQNRISLGLQVGYPFKFD